MAKTQTMEIAVRSSTDLAQLQDLEQVLLTNERQEIVDDPEQISREIMAQLLAAESDEELNQQGTTVSWREMLNVPVQLRGFKWRPSDFEEGSSVFFVVFGDRLDTGEQVVLTTGARNVLAMLVNLAKRQALVGKVVAMVASDRPTKAGYTPYWLRIIEPAEPEGERA